MGLMTLDEAIEHCEEKAKELSPCNADHAQLAKWLKELRTRREVDKCLLSVVERIGQCRTVQ